MKEARWRRHSPALANHGVNRIPERAMASARFNGNLPGLASGWLLVPLVMTGMALACLAPAWAQVPDEEEEKPRPRRPRADQAEGDRPERPARRQRQAGGDEEEGDIGGGGRDRAIAQPSWPDHGDPRGTYDGPVNVIYAKDNAPAAPKVEDLPEAKTITQYGIIWTLDRPVRVGRFVTGDHYFIGAATVVEISPRPLFGQEVPDHPDWELIEERAVREKTKVKAGTWARHGSTLNPRNTQYGGFDSRIAGSFYDPKEFTPLPIAMKPGDALVSTVSAKDPLSAYSGHGQPVKAAAVLTCLQEPAPADAFRPSYCDRTQRLYLARDLKRELLHRLPRPATAPPDLGEWGRAFQRPWLDIVRWGYANPEQNLPRYGTTMALNVSSASLLLHLDYPAIEKELLLIGFVQYGVDLAGIMRHGATPDIYRGHGGFGAGRKWPLVFAGILLDDPEIRSPKDKHPKFHFGEDDQTSWAKQYGPDAKSWSGYDVVFESHPLQRPVPNELKHPREWESTGNENYRRCCTSKVWVGHCLAARIMRAEPLWGHDPFFAYVDRWMTEDHVAQAKVLVESVKPSLNMGSTPQKIIDSGGDLGVMLTSPFMREMWNTYRHQLPPHPPGQ